MIEYQYTLFYKTKIYMWLFDSILWEESKTKDVSTSNPTSTIIATQNADTSWSINITDDSDKIIIKDINENPNPFVEINSINIPDSAVSFFSDSENPATNTSAVFNESPSEANIQEEVSPKVLEEPQILETKSLLEQDNKAQVASNFFVEDQVSQTQSELEAPETIVENIQQEQNEVTQEQNNIWLDFEKTNAKITEESDFLIPQNETNFDPNSAIVEAIDKLNVWFMWYENKINKNLKTIEGKQEQIATLKQEIKAITEETKQQWEEKDKVAKMIDLFKSQKI